MSAEMEVKVKAQLLLERGPELKVIIARVFNSKGDDISGEIVNGVITLSPYARDPLGNGAHEGMHDFFKMLTGSKDPVVQRARKILLNASNSQGVYRQLKVLLDKEPGALKSMEEGSKNFAEERLAYAYQFWRAGLLTVGPETKTTFQMITDFFRAIIGILTDDQKTTKMFEAYSAGKMVTPDAVNRVLAESIEYRERLLKNGAAYALKAVQPLVKLGETSEGRMMRTDNPDIQSIFRDFKNPRNEGNKTAYNAAHTREASKRVNEFSILMENYTPKEVELVNQYLTDGQRPADVELRKLYDGVRKIFDDMEVYMREAGVKRLEDGVWVAFGHIKNYFPRMYAVAEISLKPSEFIDEVYATHTKEIDDVIKGINSKAKAEYDALSTYEKIKLGADYAVEVIDKDQFLQSIATKITRAHGQADLGDEHAGGMGFSPMMRSVNRRPLLWLKPERLDKKWFSNDLSDTVTSYVAQGTKRAEYTRRFGPGGEGLAARMESAYQYELDKLLTADPEYQALLKTKDKKALKAAAATHEKAAMELLKPSETAIMGLEGTLGADVSPTWKMTQGTMMAYQQVRIMGASLFAQMVDPLGLIVNGGEVKDAWGAFKRGMSEVVASYKGVRSTDRDAEIAEIIGVTDVSGILADFGQQFSGLMLDKRTRAVNKGLFRWNGMEGFNRGIRIHATKVAMQFLKKHSQTPTEHSARYLKELNIEASDIKFGANGEINFENPKVADAIYRWVDGAVLRPTAAHRPVWMNDPHYTILGHMKQFGYVFNDTILKRLWNESMVRANAAPAASWLAMAVPVMIAADAAKSILLNGGLPAKWDSMDIGGIVLDGTQRAGTFGAAQPYIDVMAPYRSIAGLGGPAVEQPFSWFGQGVGESAYEALPGASIFNIMDNNDGAETIVASAPGVGSAR